MLFAVFLVTVLGRVLVTWRESSVADRDLKSAFLQSQMNKAMAGKEFSYPIKMAETLAFLTVVLVYSTAIPFVVLYGFLFLVCHYWLDKFYMLRVCKLPPRFACSLNDRASNLFAFAVVLHVFSAMWICSTPALFPTRVLVY